MATQLSEALLAKNETLRRSFQSNTEKRNLAMSARALRRTAGLTQRQVAARAHLSQSHVSKIENATGPMPSLDTLRKYAAACGAQVRVEFEPSEAVDHAPALAGTAALAS